LSIIGRFKILVTVFKDVPLFFFTGIVTATLVYNSFESLISILQRKKRPNTKYKLLVNEDLRFFCEYDIRYCYNLLNEFEHDDLFDVENELRAEREEAEAIARNATTEQEIKEFKKKRTIKKLKSTPKRLFEKFVYKWHANFKFSARIVCGHLVACVALYYVVVEWIYEGVILFANLKSTSFDLVNMLGELLFNILVETDFSMSFADLTIKDYQIAGYMVASALAYFICTLQCLLGLRSIKYNLLRAYRGRSESVGKLKGNVSICNANSHFTGFLVGFLINGFVFIFAFLFALFIALYIVIEFNFWHYIGEFLIKCISVVVVIGVKTVFNFLMSKFVFLQEKGKLLALNNFRMFSIFMYLMFFFDSIVGVISAVVRLILGILGSIFFLPRIGYSFLGRQLEQFDNGFKLSAGYYQMEAAHSNPLLITFCSMLYYKRLVNKSEEISDYDLVEIVRRQQAARSVEPTKSDNSLQVVTDLDKSTVVSVFFNKTNLVGKTTVARKAYNRRVLNRWAVVVMLIKNISLVKCRKKTCSFQNVVSF
jgi:hypothetical protein